MHSREELFGPRVREPVAGDKIVPLNQGLQVSLSYLPDTIDSAGQPFAGRAAWSCRKCGAIVVDMDVHVNFHNGLDDGWTVAEDDEPESVDAGLDAVKESGYPVPRTSDGILAPNGIKWTPTKDRINEWAQIIWDATLVNGADLTADQALHIAKCIWPEIIDWANEMGKK